MLGVAGQLVAGAFLDDHVRERADARDFARARRLAPWRAGCEALGPASALRAMVEIGAEPLIRLLGFAGLDAVSYQPGIAAATCAGPPAVAAVIAGWAQPLDALWRTAVVEARGRGADWCLLFNGTSVRLVDARRVYSRRYADVDLDLAADDEATAGALWTLCGAPAFTPAPGRRIEALIAASDEHGVAVCRSLRLGVLDASAQVTQALLPRGAADAAGAFEQALTIVYRLLFLLFAEARALVPMWHPVYRDSYSVDALRRSAERSPPPPGLWDGLRAVSRMAHAGCAAGDLRVTAFNGRLFAPARTPLAERGSVDDFAIGRAVLSLATRASSSGGRQRIAYRDLGVEQLGAVYETLLDYEPRLDRGATPGTRGTGRGAAPGPRVALQPGSGLRKATGSFYTPQPLAHYLVRRTLAPLVHDAAPERILDLKLVDPAMGSGAFLVAACDYLAHAYEAALIAAGGCHASDFGPPERARIRRTIAERCLYGVDLNPMAVQLARLSLWLLTLAVDRPLTFLDHHLQSGDSLLGAWLANLRHPPTRRRPAAPLPLFDTPELGDALRVALPTRFTLATAPGDTLDQVRDKERLLAALTGRGAALARWKQIADLWCGSWLDEGGAPPAAFAALSDRILTGSGALAEPLADALLEAAAAAAGRHRFFHWELEFPEVFFDRHGERREAPGFDAVIGNPPWDMVRADAGPPAERARAQRQTTRVVRFARDAGVYAAQGDGHVNRYQLFVERAVQLLRRGGRLGLVLPSGVVADHGSAALRRLLFARCGVDAVVGFDNRRGVFPIHRSVRFVLLTATGGQPTGEIACRLGEHSPAALESGGPDADPAWFPVRVTPALLERLTGRDAALPELRAPIDLAIAERAAALFRPLGDPGGWGVRFGRELNATDDRDRFQPPGRGLPVLEGKHVEPFRADAAAARWSLPARTADRLLGVRHRAWRLGYRDVASATNQLTLIAALLPPGTVTTHTLFCLRTALPRAAQHFLCGLFNSFVINYLVRLRVATHVTTAIVEQLPVPTREEAAGWREIAGLAAMLSDADRAAPDAASTRRSLMAELNARTAELYRLSGAEFAHVLGSFPLVPAEEREAARLAFAGRRGGAG